MGLIHELRRRKVTRVATVYAVIAWLIVQVVSTIEEPLNLPGWFDTAVIILLAVGFPIAITFAWIYELSPEGIRTTPPATRASRAETAGLGRLSLLLQGTILILVGFLIVDQYLLNDPPAVPDPIHRSSQVTRFEVGFDIQAIGRGRGVLAISPQGDQYVYSEPNGLKLRRMDVLETRILVAGPYANSLAFSPSGDQVAFHTTDSEEIMRVALSGGAPVRVARGVGRAFGLSWGADDHIYFGQPDGVYRVAADGSAQQERIIEAENDLQVFGPEWIGKDRILYSVSPVGAWDDARVLVRSLATGEETQLLAGGTSARFIGEDLLIYALADRLYGVRVDRQTLEVSGQPVMLLEGVLRANGAWMTGVAHYDIADNGTLVYLDDGFDVPRHVVWVDPDGVEEPLKIEPRLYSDIRLSPDGTRLVINESNLPENDLWIWDLKRETSARMRLGVNGGDSPVWAKDGRRIAYHPSVTPVIDWQSTTGVAAPERLVTGYPGALDPWHPWEFTLDDRALLFEGRDNPEDGLDIGLARLDGDDAITWLINGPHHQRTPDLSPDNRWIAYQSDESGRNEIYMRPFPDVDGDKWIVSNFGGTHPLWAPDGRAIYFLQPGLVPSMMRAEIATRQSRLEVGQIREVMPWPYYADPFSRPYELSGDGRRFLALKEVDVPRSVPRIIVVQNWLSEIDARVSP